MASGMGDLFMLPTFQVKGWPLHNHGPYPGYSAPYGPSGPSDFIDSLMRGPEEWIEKED